MTWPRFLRSRVKDRPNLVAFTDEQRVLRIYSNADPQWTENGPSNVDISFQTKLKIFRQKDEDWNSRLYSPFVTCINYFVMNSYMNSTGLQCFP